MTDSEIVAEQAAQEELKRLRAEELAKIEAEKKKPKKQRRLEAEQRFLGRVIREANDKGDIRKVVASLNVSWRHFIDNRHRVLWRALETFNLLDWRERREIIEKEAYGDSPLPGTSNYIIEDDFVRGMPGSAAEKAFAKKQEESEKAIIWLERELEAADALRLVGGKVYLREITEIGEELFADINFYKDKLYG